MYKTHFIDIKISIFRYTSKKYCLFIKTSNIFLSHILNNSISPISQYSKQPSKVLNNNCSTMAGFVINWC